MAVFPSQLALPRGYYTTVPPIFHHFTVVHYRPHLHRLLAPICLRSSTGVLRSLSPGLPQTTTTTPLLHLKPFLLSQWKPILSGWISSGISVYSLSQIVPEVGNLSLIMGRTDAVTLQKKVLVLVALSLVRIIANYLQQAFLWDAALNCAYNLRVFVYERILQRDLGFFEGKDGTSSGDIAYRITAEADDVADTVYSLLNTTVPSTLQIFAMTGQMLIINPVLSLFSAMVIPAIALITGLLGEKLRQTSNQAHLTAASLAAYLNEVLPAILFVKANNAEHSENIRFQSRASADLFASLRKKKLKSLIPQIVLMLYSGVLFAFCAASVVLSRGSSDFSAMVSFVTSLYLLIEPIQGVGKAYNEFKQGEPAVDRLFSLTSFASQVAERPDSVDLDSVNGEVKFSGVSFKYHDSGHLVLNEVDLHIRAGQTVAVVGPSGGGKTTIAKLLLRLYDPLCGSIHIDGYDIRSIRLENLRRHVGLVSQDITLFSGTIAENIGYRDLIGEIDMERVELAARTANADEFIQTLPNKYQTNIGPRGAILSGGQRQRLAIARALYHNPSILIMDEATSALDRASEILVRQALQHLLQTRTVLVITHRVETVRMAERVLLLKHGKLVELNHSSSLPSHWATLGLEI